MDPLKILIILVYTAQTTLRASVAAGDPDHCPVKRNFFGKRSSIQQIKCYSCNTMYNPECNDPFRRRNQAPASVPLVDCNEYCFKWAFKTPDGRRQLARNCSTSLNVKMEKYLVCITESRSDVGFLCFCNKDKCNKADIIQLSHTLTILCFLLLFASFWASP
ncbi:unnamed protein product [Calicophoron daubneyi]|uniref:UPAR/Ly6 domain-containing protein qvr n=1 Tax=Calicophoron daubneyi TaxID=300641 RepID=A0AAV2TYT7_CALDB